MSTVTLHRVLRASPERVYRAFLDAAALSKWLPPHGFTNTVEHLDARVGGTFRMAFIQFGSGQRHAFGGTYRELVPNALLRYDDVFDDPSLPGTLLTTVRLLPLPCGTDLHVVQEDSRTDPAARLLPGLAGVADLAGVVGGSAARGVNLAPQRPLHDRCGGAAMSGLSSG